MKKKNFTSLLDNLTATKDRSQKFRWVVLVLFSSAIIITFIALISMASEQ